MNTTPETDEVAEVEELTTGACLADVFLTLFIAGMNFFAFSEAWKAPSGQLWKTYNENMPVWMQIVMALFVYSAATKKVTVKKK
jgi:hypothetical protein